jgi:hypothetical protein
MSSLTPEEWIMSIWSIGSCFSVIFVVNREGGASASLVVAGFGAKLLVSECHTSGACVRRAKKASKRKRSGLLVFSKLPRLPSADRLPDLFRIFLVCKPMSLIWVSLGWFDYSKMWETTIRLRLIRQLVIKDVSRRLLKSIGREKCKHRCPK